MPSTAISIRRLSIRWHGRGGFGAKTAAALLAELIIDLGGYGQAAPEFGPERRGAPMQAYTRISPEPIRRRGPIDAPDVLVVLDPRLLRTPTVTAGLQPEAWVLVNAATAPAVPGVRPERIIAVDASRIAREHIGREIPNVPMLAAVVMMFAPIPPEQFLAWLERRLGREFSSEIVAANLQAASAAMKGVTCDWPDMARA
jgi:pyruvate ferredoxin oxidoreductase gamma subunit